jgi:5-methylcytosine-specific restriction enzyme A
MAWSKESRQSRGYGARWDRLRLQVLRRDGYLCQCDHCKGGALRVTPAQEVDHVLPKAKGGTDDPDNLAAIAHECHVRKTVEEQGGKRKPKIGLDGFPIL